MSHSNHFKKLIQAVRIAEYCEANKISTSEGLERVAASEAREHARRMSRREFLRTTGRLAAAGAIGSAGWPMGSALAAAAKTAVNVAIVGAGLAGLACADELQRNGIVATIYDANNRVGGRCFSLSGFFPGQVAERGGEFIDNLHKTMLGYAQQFELALEDVEKEPGAVFYFFNGQLYPESVVVDEFRALVPAMRDDLRTLSVPTAANHTDAEAALDFTDLRAYLDSRSAGNIAKKAIEQAYIAEYGLEIDQQSCLNFLLFIHADRRSKFRPFGHSDERYHVIGGNDQIVTGLSSRLNGQIRLGLSLVKARKTAGGDIELTFADGPKILSVVHDAVVFALPFSTLREATLDASLALPPWKLRAINELRYGTNAKMMIGFDARPWIGLGSRGTSYSDLPNHQNTWETNPINANQRRAVLTDYSGGSRGAGLDSNNVQVEASRFLDDLDRIYPGALTAASRDAQGNFRSHLEHWPSNPLVQGSYTCNHPGYFTTIADNEATPIGNLYFAGEHTSSFYEWQGFMEGAALSGIRAAKEILQDLKRGTLR
jgi:monoamine oxidase